MCREYEARRSLRCVKAVLFDVLFGAPVTCVTCHPAPVENGVGNERKAMRKCFPMSVISVALPALPALPALEGAAVSIGIVCACGGRGTTARSTHSTGSGPAAGSGQAGRWPLPGALLVWDVKERGTVEVSKGESEDSNFASESCAQRSSKSLRLPCFFRIAWVGAVVERGRGDFSRKTGGLA
jgi:hypothetical protein